MVTPLRTRHWRPNNLFHFTTTKGGIMNTRGYNQTAVKISLIFAFGLGFFGLAAAPQAGAQLAPFTTENGLISLSADAIGTNAASGIVQVEKPVGATVRKAYLFAATVPNNTTISDTDITLDGNAVAFDATVSNNFSGSVGNNYRGDVTSLVKAKIDAAPAGLVDFTIAEDPTKNTSIDGEILAVIFDDPNLTTSNSIVLLFGAQDPTGDNFMILLGNPIDTSAPGFALDLSLGISFGFQGGGQYSQIDVSTNTNAPMRLTTSAGGQDDGEPADGALITVGGIGDTNDNPPDPDALPTDERSDDELYDLIPFVNNGDTNIDVATFNPSNDDNIFFAALVFGANTAVVGEGIVLVPASSTDRVGQLQTVTATVQDNDGQPVAAQAVTFHVISGPNEDLMETNDTDENGKATFTYTSTDAGTDMIEACFTNSQMEEVCSNTVDVTWIAAPTGLRNLSTRAHVMGGDQRTIGGFMITGDEPKDVLIRGIGPSLPASVSMKLSDPVLSLFDSSSPDPIAANNDWKSDQQTEIEDTGLAPEDDLEAAIVATLAPGAYTAILEGNGGSTGIGLVEIYDITPNSNSLMANMSTRSLVETEDNVMIGGLILDPADDPIAAVIRAIGPSMGDVPGSLEDPTLDLHDANGTLISSNDDWQDDPEQTSIPTELQPSDPRESALYRMLEPGAYTAIVRSATETSGIGLVEIYVMPAVPMTQH
ncbi:MAG: Ig-like domain-containing protein [Spartobacteria bacterium]